jgi:hypothetical protein
MEQLELIDLIIERIELMGGVATTDAGRVAAATTVRFRPGGVTGTSVRRRPRSQELDECRGRSQAWT